MHAISASKNITVNLVQPGSTDTDMNPADAAGADEQRALGALGRFADAGGYRGLPSHSWRVRARRNITGAVLTVDGGTNA